MRVEACMKCGKLIEGDNIIFDTEANPYCSEECRDISEFYCDGCNSYFNYNTNEWFEEDGLIYCDKCYNKMVMKK